MKTTTFKVYKYRWVMLFVYMFIVAVNQMLWITFAPITSNAAKFYQVSDIQIGILSMSFMIVFIVMSFPASWLIDKYGIRIGVGTGAVLTGVFGLLRGVVKDDYTLLLMAQIGIAVGQPFLLNAITKLAARWFPIEERATAAGLGTFSMYIGILIAMMLTPYLTISHGINGVLNIYGVTAAVAAALFLIFSKENPPTAPCRPDQEERSLVLDGLKDMLKNRGFYLLLFIFFIGLGIFNSVTTWIEDILKPRGFSATQAGIAGGLMIIGGIVGALIMPMLSDHYKKRVPFIITALAGSTLGLIGLTFTSNYIMILLSSVLFGYFLLSAGPIGFQYGAEITYPASEGTSNGFILLAGQISGIAFIFGMDGLKSPETGSMTTPLIYLIVLMFVATAASFKLKESKLLKETESNS
ncbi:MAG: MFS transporter [Bacteroidetes bacterium]|nr:MAG: MFS transporter [Bacteroidota bacterium]